MVFNVSDGKIICLFGGEDIERVRKFTNTARTVARAANFPIEMLYVGKSNPREKVRKNNSIIAAENLSHHLTDLTLIWFFWSWAVICKGSGASEMAKAKGDTILQALTEYDQWKETVVDLGFVPALIEYLKKLHSPLHCNRLILPGLTGSIPEKVVCAECSRPMEKFIMYRCCTD
nr:protein sieve element occlusion a [Quercus suber]